MKNEKAKQPVGDQEEKLNISETAEDEIRKEINHETREFFVAREKRIEVEDEILHTSETQRKITVLDYFRRGKRNDNLYIMPELIDILPQLIKSDKIINFSAEYYDEKQTIEKITQEFLKIESDVIDQDRQITDLLSKHGVIVDKKSFLTFKWYQENILKQLKFYFASINKPIHQNNPLRDNPEEYKKQIRQKVSNNLAGYLNGNIDELLSVYELDQQEFELSASSIREKDEIEELVLKIKKNGFLRYPRDDEYEGERVQVVPDLSKQRIRPGILVVERDQVPNTKGGVIIDGNFGYDTNGELRKSNDKLIIDHHDQLDDKRYDTATIMSNRYWLEGNQKKINLREKRKQMGQFEDEKGRVVTMINHLDSDSILSVWSFRNPHKAEKYRAILNNISIAGDFLLGSGVMEYGATAREYEYIFRNYLVECKEEVLKKRTRLLEQEVVEKKKQLAETEIEKQLQALVAQIESVISSDSESVALKKEIDDLKKNTDIPGKEKGQLVSQKNRQLTEMLNSKLGDKLEKRKELEKILQTESTMIKGLEKKITELRSKKITNEEMLKILNHVLDILEEIITKPFKYSKYKDRGIAEEDSTIAQVDKDYKEGKIEIASDVKDNEILIISPLKAKKMPEYESIDGLYFYLRKRENFNKELVVTLQGDSYFLAINTQHGEGLRKYDFNTLIDKLRIKEESIIKGLLDDKASQLAAITDKVSLAKLQKEIAGLEVDLERNKKGQLWRNRTQMLFSFKSYMSSDEFLEIVRVWKNAR